MRRFSVSGYWSGAHFSAADQARFFRVFDRLTPPRSRGYARTLLSSIVAWQRWGFSRFSLAAGFDTFFKGGWRSTALGRARARGRPVRARPAAGLDGAAQRRQPVARLRHGHAPRRRSANIYDASRGLAPPDPRGTWPVGGSCERGSGRRVAARRPQRRPAARARDPRRARLRDPGQPHRAAAPRLLREPGLPAAPRPPATSPACSATCAAGGSACSCSMPTARRARHGRSCAGPSAAGAATSSAPTSPGAAATTSAVPWT